MASQGIPKIDRQSTTPFLVRLFFKQGTFHRLDEFDPSQSRLPTNVQIYTWQSCSLRELCKLLLSAVPTLLPQPFAGSRIAFRLVYPDIQGSNRPGMAGRYTSRDIGSVIVGAHSSNEDVEMNDENGSFVADALKQLDGDPDRTLADVKFLIGDYVACAVLPPLADGGIPAAPSSLSGPGRSLPSGRYTGRGRENGFGGRDDYGSHGREARGGRYDDRRPSGSVPGGEWRRGEALPDRDMTCDRGRGGSRGHDVGDWRYRGRGRGRGRW